MTEFETRLREVLEDKAGSVTADRARQHGTMRRARTRRAGTFALGIAALLTIVAGSVGVVRTLSEPRAFDPAGPDRSGEARAWGFDGSFTNEYPQIARGTFTGGEWALEGTRGTLGDGSGIDTLDVRLNLEQGEGNPGEVFSIEVVPSDDPLLAQEVELEDGSGRVVFGATFNATHSVEAVLEDGSTQHALIFTGYDDRSTIDAQYFLMFLPSDQEGYVFARDWLGVDFEREPVGGAPEIAAEQLPLMSGSFNDRAWEMETSRNENRPVSCLVVDWGQRQGEGCYSGHEAGSLLLRAVDLGDGAKALMGFQPLDHSNLQISIGDRELPLQIVMDPHERFGFPFAVVVEADAHGVITSVDPEGEEVPYDF